MASFKVLACIAFGLLALSSKADATCAVCSSISYAACINTTAFRVCLDGQVASEQILSCPDGTLCTDSQGICLPPADAIVSCEVTNECNKCTGTFACVSKTEFGYCDSNGLIIVTATCPEKQHCNVEQFASIGEICSLNCLTEPTCDNDVAVTQAPPVLDFKDTCTSTTVAGYYKNIYDATCKTYVYCESLNSVMNAILYTCTSGYFAQDTQRCTTTKPTGCT